MPRPNQPTDPEYDNALDSAAHYRLKCLKLEEERDTLLAVLERTLDHAVGHACDAREISRAECGEWPWVQEAREAINKTEDA